VSDFAQTGLISTLQQLNEGHGAALENELRQICRATPIALILPCHGPDLQRPAFAHILRELRGADFLEEILFSVNGLRGAPGLTGFASALPADVAPLFKALPQRLQVLWNDCPAPLPASKEAAPGKGLNVWAAVGMLLRKSRAQIFVLQDCDVASFRRSTLARLCYASAHPQLGYRFAKMYYSRATDRLYGRVSRLFFAPLLHALVRINGHHPLVDFLLSFRYPLAGECAFHREVAERLPLSSGWGLETGMLCDLFRLIDPRRICQVDGGSGYDHKHQPGSGALARMATEIAGTLLDHLREEGILVNTGLRDALAVAYHREARLAVQQSANLALINGLAYDAEAETALVDIFKQQLEQSPLRGSAPLPCWASVRRPEFDATEDWLDQAARKMPPERD
jgi:glucosyl-3-phosphoglycerate synthase